MSGGTNSTINYKTRTVRISHPTGFVVYGGQFGSEGKGQLAGTLAMELGADASVSAFTPNAGHTFKMGSLIALVERRLRSKTLKDYYSKLVFKAIPCSSWITPKVYITPASVFDPTRLVAEALICKLINPNLVIYVHSNSMVLCDEHRELEAQMVGGVSSTRQGTFGAMVEKMSRSEDAHTAGKWIRSWIADREVYGDM